MIPRNDRDPLKPEDIQALKRAGEILLQHGVTHVLVDQDKKAFTVRSFNHGWRNGSGENLASAFWSHFEQELRSDGMPLEAMLITPSSVLSDEEILAARDLTKLTPEERGRYNALREQQARDARLLDGPIGNTD